MHRFIDGEDRLQQTLPPNSLEDYVSEENPVRVVEVFIDELDLAALGFSGMRPAATGRPAYHPSTLLKIYLYGYLNRVQSSRRLEREAQRNIELMWLAGRLAPDFKTIADFPKDNGAARQQMQALKVMQQTVQDAPDRQVSLTDPTRAPNSPKSVAASITPKTSTATAI